MLHMGLYQNYQILTATEGEISSRLHMGLYQNYQILTATEGEISSRLHMGLYQNYQIFTATEGEISSMLHMGLYQNYQIFTATEGEISSRLHMGLYQNYQIFTATEGKFDSIGCDTKKADWRRKHEDFIATIRAAKQAQAHIAAGGKVSDLPPPPPSDYSDYVQCPHCNRRFNTAAADRHIPRCATMLHNKPKSVSKGAVPKRR
uniref:C2HC/C3H-type domain-containing protein n=1 Tax=Timema douglasi TaxID=61478 RepID=A0A7R8VZ21_TIMDO|nr:unnamed protein product [Timema douglasi]